jgi:uncharacterized cupredoxin-like copper-binding protein
MVRRSNSVDALRAVARKTTFAEAEEPAPRRRGSRVVTRRSLLVPGLLLLVLTAAACGSDSPAAGRTVEVSFTDEGCVPSELTIPSGKTSFHVKNDGADSISEFEVLDSGGKILGEKESLSPGLDGTFTIDLKPGSYVLACPGGTKHPTGTLTVSDSGTSAGDAHSTEAAAECVPSGASNEAAVHLKATLSDFKIQLGQSTVAAGAVSFDGTNTGTHPHEIVVVKGVSPTELKSDATGGVDEEQLPDGALIGELEAFSPGRSCSAGFELTAGSYTLFCNTVGDEGSHFQQGMVTTLTVT